MRKYILGLMACLLVLIAWSPAVMAASEWKVLQTLRVGKKPVDLLVSTDRGQIYVLTEEGQLLIYGADGQLRDAIEVGGKIDQVRQGPSPDTLFLLSREEATVQMVRIRQIENIDIREAPYKGAADAVVNIAVFSDFQ